MDELVRAESISPEIYGILVLRLFRPNPERLYSPSQIRICVEKQLGILNAQDRYPIEFEYIKFGRLRWRDQLTNTIRRLRNSGCLDRKSGVYTITTEGLKVLGTLNLGINRDGGDPSICITYKLGQSMALADPWDLPAKLMGPSRYKQVRIKSRFSVPQLISDSGWPYIERQIGKSLD